VATCARCCGDEFKTFRSQRPTGNVKLYWMCDGCYPDSPMVPYKPRGLAFYRRLTYQILLPAAAAIFAMVELGIHV
jgi:hypothetical protein